MPWALVFVHHQCKIAMGIGEGCSRRQDQMTWDQMVARQKPPLWTYLGSSAIDVLPCVSDRVGSSHYCCCGDEGKMRRVALLVVEQHADGTCCLWNYGRMPEPMAHERSLPPPRLAAVVYWSFASWPALLSLPVFRYLLHGRRRKTRAKMME